MNSMPSREEVKAIAERTVISSVTNFIIKRKNKKPNFQILDLIIPTERKIRSVVGGMETSLGTTLWEPLAIELAKANGFNIVKQKLEAPKNMPANIQGTLQSLLEERYKSTSIYDAQYCHARIKEACQVYLNSPITEFIKPKSGEGVDIWLEKGGTNYFFDTKTVKPSLKDYKNFINQLFNWYASFYSRFPNQIAEARIVFPYNPYTRDDFWSKTTGKGKPLQKSEEAWVENEFWDFCSGLENTYELIYEAFVDISKSGILEEIIQEIFYGHSLE